MDLVGARNAYGHDDGNWAEDGERSRRDRANFESRTLEYGLPFRPWQPVREMQPRDTVGHEYVAFG